ncbi:MAG: MATE family efflux transporter [Pseudomonadota bacterium]
MSDAQTAPVTQVNAPSGSGWAWHIKRTLILAGPLILSRVGLLLMTTLDVVVVGRAGAQELAYYVLGYAVLDSLLAVMAGLQLGVPVLTARSIGQGKPQLAAIIWKRGVILCLVAGVAAAAFLQFAPAFFLATGQEPELAREGGAVTALLALSLPFSALFLVSAMFLEALEKPLYATAAVMVANVFNLVLSIVFVFGAGPIPAMGAWGCALATVITSAGLGIGLACFVRFGLKGRNEFGFAKILDRTEVASAPASEQRRLGYAAGASYGLEAASFAGVTILAGLLGVIGLAAMGVLFQLFALTFMISFGIAGATQVRVGNAWGRGDPVGMAQAGWVGFGLSVIISVSVSAAYVVAPRFFAGLLTNDAAVLAATQTVMIWMVLALLTDGGQCVLNHACRGRGDTWVPTAFHVVSYWVIMLPLAWWLAIARDGGASGLYQAILVSTFVSMLAMGARFILLSRDGLPDGAKPALS